ncbi:MAG: lipid II:glycine glycyltransferase FemX [Calditrichaceae bacterium]
MKPPYSIIDPRCMTEYDKLVLNCPDYTFFHSSAWAKVLSESYGYHPAYVAVINKGTFEFLLPLMEINSHFTGKRAVALPFSDFCGPLMAGSGWYESLLPFLKEQGKVSDWDYIEIRGGENIFSDFNPSVSYLTHEIDLSENMDGLQSGFRSSTRRNINKAVSNGLKIELLNSENAVGIFYRLNCQTRKKHGLPPQPFSFFKSIHTHIVSKNGGMIALASRKSEYVAGALFLHFGEKAIYKYGASDPNHADLRANYLIFNEVIKWYSEQGFKSLHFGRTSSDNEGLRQFKTGWGVKEMLTRYYKYDLQREKFITDRQKENGFYNKIFRNIPVPVSVFIGSKLYKHVG